LFVVGKNITPPTPHSGFWTHKIALNVSTR
jgi:hypothetical protein